MKKVDEDTLMRKIFEFLKDMPGFENLKEIRYDRVNSLIWIKIGIAERVIPIRDDLTWLGVTREVISELEKEKLWNTYLDMMNGKQHRQTSQGRQIDVIPVGVVYGRVTEYTK